MMTRRRLADLLTRVAMSCALLAAAGCAVTASPATPLNTAATPVKDAIAAPTVPDEASPPAAFPEPPENTPKPWVRYAVERAMGAKCSAYDLRSPGGPIPETSEFFPAGGCKGRMPAHLVRLSLALPDDALNMTRAFRERDLNRDVMFPAAPGHGRRPDFLALGRLWVIRTFEGPDPNVTVFAVWGGACGPPRLGSSTDVWPCTHRTYPLFYRVVGDGPPQEVTDELWPGPPVITPEQQAVLDEHSPGPVYLDVYKLGDAPTMRWSMDFDPDNPPKHNAPLPPGWARGHFGFLVWNGTHFEKHFTVPRALWPCTPVEKGAEKCASDIGFNPEFIHH
jgi:hypothetical protein